MHGEIDEEALGRGIELFNRQRFFEAHEVWEVGWKRARGEQKLFFQCLIQIAAALLHAGRGNRRGAEMLANKARSKIAELPQQMAGIKTIELRMILDKGLRNVSENDFLALCIQQESKKPI
jgi:predicted metal-dependent hydrolase